MSCEAYRDLFTEVRTFGNSKYLHVVGILSDIKRKSFPGKGEKIKDDELFARIALQLEQARMPIPDELFYKLDRGSANFCCS
jgi:hypothetical protein